MNVVDLSEFHKSAQGRLAAGLILAKLSRLVQPGPGQVVMGLGFAPPYLDALVPPGVLGLAFMPAWGGVIHWPDAGHTRSALVDEHDLPLLESVVDVALVVHGLEFADAPLDVLQEIWRVLAPQGRVVLVLPNRRGLWAGSERTPFGQGQPFSRSQIGALLREAKFSVTRWGSALYVPPLVHHMAPGAALWLDRAGERLLPGFPGVIIVEAMKQVYAFSAGKRARRLVPRLRPVLLPNLQPTPREEGGR